MSVPLARIYFNEKAKRYMRGNRFVSKSAYTSQQWRLQGGKAGTARKASIKKATEGAMRARWGAPPAGKSWIQIAGKYPERFEQYMDEIQEEFR